MHKPGIRRKYEEPFVRISCHDLGEKYHSKNFKSRGEQRFYVLASWIVHFSLHRSNRSVQVHHL